MIVTDPKTFLWSNICLLVGAQDPTVDFIQARIKVGRGTVQRIKAKETSVGTDVLTEIAKNLGVQPWELLLPNLQEHISAGRKADVLNVSAPFPPTNGELRKLVQLLAISLTAASPDARETAASLLESLAKNPANSKTANVLVAILGTGVPDDQLEHLSAKKSQTSGSKN